MDTPTPKALPWYSKCFVCGDEPSHKLAARFRFDGEKATTTYTPTEAHMGYPGIAHGGIVSALLDETMGWAAIEMTKRFCLSVDLSIRFSLPLPIGREVTVSARMTRDRGRIWEGEADMRDADGALYARATGKYVPLSIEDTRGMIDQLAHGETEADWRKWMAEADKADGDGPDERRTR